MAEVWRVKAAAEEGNAPRSLRELIHPLIVNGFDSIRPVMRFVIAFLALAGVVVASLALHVHYSTETEACSINEKWDCGIVNHSPFAVIGPVPVAAIGIGGYLVLAGLAMAKRRRVLLVLACVALAFGLRLTYIEKYILEVYCLYCVISFALTILITLLSLGWAMAEARSRRRSMA
jgi:uncharacterized membrane protein